MTDDTCALWFVCWGATQYELHTSEQDAAESAVVMSNSNDGAPLGVQFADGRTVPLFQWDAYDEADRSFDEQWKTDGQTMAERPTREVRDPFDNVMVKVDGSAPAWLGKPTPFVPTHEVMSGEEFTSPVGDD